MGHDAHVAAPLLAGRVLCLGHAGDTDEQEQHEHGWAHGSGGVLVYH